MKCLFKTLKSHLGETYDANMRFAWKCFAFQASLCLKQPVTRRPLSAAEIRRIGAMKRRSPVKSASTVPPTWVDRVANTEEEMAALKIQALFRGFFVRRLARAYCPSMLLGILFGLMREGRGGEGRNTALHCTALHCTALHCTALHSTQPSTTHI